MKTNNITQNQETAKEFFNKFPSEGGFQLADAGTTFNCSAVEYMEHKLQGNS
tara:strand:- start:604 stop:759 length:156 start_codon:yes stop_codon:yes gene_type:complete